MPASSWKVEDLIPHRPPMVLIDVVESVDLATSTAVARFTAREEWRGNWFALEYMAQTAAVLAGATDKSAGLPTGRPGFLLGTRRLDLGLEEFVPGIEYEVKVVREYEDGDSAAFACEIRPVGSAESGPACIATLTAYRPPCA